MTNTHDDRKIDDEKTISDVGNNSNFEDFWEEVFFGLRPTYFPLGEDPPRDEDYTRSGSTPKTFHAHRYQVRDEALHEFEKICGRRGLDISDVCPEIVDLEMPVHVWKKSGRF